MAEPPETIYGLPLITHPRDTVGDYQHRLLLHIAPGILMGIPILGWSLVALFLHYQENEDRHVQDQAWKDCAGAMVGASITILVCVALVIWWAV